MIIKNILINGNIDIYIEKLLEELTTNNISYLYIKESMELHFNNYILRFYTPEIILNIIKKTLEEITFDNIFDNFNIYKLDDKIDIPIENPKYNFNQRKNIKNENRKNNQIIKKQLKYKLNVYKHIKKPYK